MSKPKNPDKRRIHFIKKDFQFKFILKFCLLVLLGAVISTVLLSVFAKGTLTTSFKGSQLVIEKTYTAVLPALIYTNLITVVLITLATIFVTLYVSHKLAGPMFRFEADLKMIGEGDLTKRIQIRQQDQLSDFVESLNGMTESLHHKVLDTRADIQRVIDEASGQHAQSDLIMDLKNILDKIESNFNL
jgi:methyl-accepting chemotaxis protein